jgi:hypothetical protein
MREANSAKRDPLFGGLISFHCFLEKAFAELAIASSSAEASALETVAQISPVAGSHKSSSGRKADVMT